MFGFLYILLGILIQDIPHPAYYSFSQNGGGQSWRYENSGPFTDTPTEYTDPAGTVFSIATSATGQTIANGGLSQTLQFSGSGAVAAQTDLNGFEVGAADTAFYVPDDQQPDGYLTQQGRLSRAPIADRDDAGTRYTYNPYGEVADSETLGVKTTYSYDELGRISAVSEPGGVSHQTGYQYQNGLFRVTLSEFGGRTTVSDYDPAGRMVNQTISAGSDSHTRKYSYDDLDRLVKVEASENGAGLTQVYAATYQGDQFTPTTETTPDGAVSYTLSLDFIPRVTGATYSRGQESRSVRLVTDALGRVITGEEPGRGEVTYQYDGWSRLIRVAPADAGKAGTFFSEISYGKTTTVTDGTNGLVRAVTAEDAAGWDYKIKLSGPGFNAIERTYTTNVSGQLLEVNESGSGLDQPRLNRYNSRGYYMGWSHQGLSFLAGEGDLDARGRPLHFGGNWSADFGYDDLNRVTSTTDPHGNVMGYAWDQLDRARTITDSRGKALDVDYLHPGGGQVARVASRGADGVTLFSRDRIEQSQSESPLGDQLSATVGLNGAQSLTRGGDTAQFNHDPASGNLIGYSDLSGVSATLPRDSLGRIAGDVTIGGEQYSVAWSEVGDAVTITPAVTNVGKAETARATTVRYDGLGRLVEIQKGGEFLKLTRDDLGRLSQVGLPSRTLDYQYEGLKLTGISGGTRPILFSGHDETLRPGKIEIGDLAEADVTYGSGGRPQSVSLARKGGLAETWNFNQHGDVTGIERPGQSPVNYTLNAWGMPASMAWKGETFNLFGEKDNLTWNLPAGLTMTLNERGNVTQLDRAGQGSKTYDYDGGDRLVTEKLNGAVRRTYGYEGYRLKTISNADEVVTLERDAEHRISGYSSDVRGNLGSMAYDDAADGQGRMLSYTDPNGVTTEYGYDADGRVTKIDIKNGPTFLYAYDGAGNITHVEVDDLSAAFADYQAGLPETITWERRGEAVVSFTVSRNSDDRLDKIEGGGYLLDLTWDNEQIATITEPKIIGLTRQGPDFSEVWSYSYDSNGFLSGATVTRSNGDQISETYTPSDNGIPTRLERVLNGLTILDLNKTIDQADTHVTAMTNDASGTAYTLTYDDLGNLTDLLDADWTTDLDYDAERRITRMRVDRGTGDIHEENHNYDYNSRRSDSSGTSLGRTVYAYHDSRVIAIGTKLFGGVIRWSHAIGHGPLGPVFIKDLSGNGRDVFIFTDHLGTPFANRDAETGDAAYTPFSPWGELLAEAPGSRPYAEGVVPTAGFTLATDGVYALPPIGLAGHLYESATGLVYMHHRYYAPRLGHFLTPDFRPMDIYDPSTFTEPYAYAVGNPVTFWDPDGLAVSIGGLPAPTVFDDDLTPFILGLIESGATGQQIKLWSDTYLKGHMSQWTGALSESELLLYNALVAEGRAPATFDPSNNALLRQSVQPLFKEHYGTILFHLFRQDFNDPSDIPSGLSEKAWNYGRRRILLYTLIMNSAQAKASLAAAAGGSEIAYQLNPITFAWDKGWTMGSGESFISGEESSRLRALGEFGLALAMIKGLDTLRSHTFVQPQFRTIQNFYGEFYYRTMSQADYQALLETGMVSATGETFISPTLEFSSSYQGVTVRFQLQPGTTSALRAVGVRDNSLRTRQMFGDLQPVQKGWSNSSAFFKLEGNQINIGLGKGAALDIFNRSIINFKVVKP